MAKRVAKTGAMLPWDARAAPLYLLARLYLIVRADLDSQQRWRAARPLSGWPEPIRRAADAPSFCPSPHDCLCVNELLIKGICRNGRTFRPSDWAERLCGAAALFLPDATLPSGAQPTARPYHGYSAYVRPAIISGVYCVIIDARLRDLEPRAWDYVTGFARDNDLVTLDVADFVAAPALPEISPAAA